MLKYLKYLITMFIVAAVLLLSGTVAKVRFLKSFYPPLIVQKLQLLFLHCLGNRYIEFLGDNS